MNEWMNKWMSKRLTPQTKVFLWKISSERDDNKYNDSEQDCHINERIGVQY